MRIAILYGSPHLDSRTAGMLGHLLREFQGHELDMLDAYALAVAPCTDCGGCAQSGRCAVSDSMNEVYEALEAADAVVFCTPVYFAAPPAPLKAIIDRLQAFYMRERPGWPIKAAGLVTTDRSREGDMAAISRVLRTAAFALSADYLGTEFISREEYASEHMQADVGQKVARRIIGEE